MKLLGTTCFLSYLGSEYHSTVYSLFAVETAAQGIETHKVWYTLGAGWGNPSHLFVNPPPAIACPALVGIVMSLVHEFYCWRIVVLGRRWIVAIAIAGVSYLCSSTRVLLVLIFVHDKAFVGELGAEDLHDVFRE